MKKKLFAVFTATMILCSLCACKGQEQPEESTSGQTTGVQVTTEAKETTEDFRWLTYEEYLALTPEQQQAYYESFPTPEEYMVWFNAAAKEHNQQSEDNGTYVEGNEGYLTQPTEEDSPDVPQPDSNAAGTQERKDPTLLTYEEYLKLSPALQQAYCESFSSMDAYMQWFNAAVKEYNDNKNDTPPKTEGNEGQITQPTEPEADAQQPTEEKVFLEGTGVARPDGR